MYPILIKYGPINIYAYGFMVATGILVAAVLCQLQAKKIGLSSEKIVDLIFWIVIFGLLGGRITYVLLNWDYYFQNPLEILMLHKGGLVFYGSFFFGLIIAFIYIRKNRLPFLPTADLISGYIPLAHAFGRVGCYLNGCCYGKPSAVPWAVSFPDSYIKLHPVQLYSAFLLLSIFFILILVARKKKFDGEIFSLYLILCGVERFFMEFFRGDHGVMLGVLTGYQLMSILLIICGTVIFIRLLSKNKR